MISVFSHTGNHSRMQSLFDKTWKYSLFMKNPKERAGVFSRLFFSWMNSLMNIGNKRSLEHSDLYPLLDEDKSKGLTEKLEQAWQEEVRKSHTSGRKARLSRAMMKALPWSDYALAGISLFIGVACNILQPLFLSLLLSLLLKSEAERQHRWLYTYACGLCCSTLFRIVVMNQYQSKVNFMGMRWRAAAIGVIYKKVIILLPRNHGVFNQAWKKLWEQPKLSLWFPSHTQIEFYS